MPNPRNRIKSTGDTHLPDMGDEGGADADVLRFEPAAPHDDEPGSAMPQVEAALESSRGWLEAARNEVRTRPVRALGGAFALGVLLAWF